MENYQGDLADIVHASVSGGSITGNSATFTSLTDMQFPSNQIGCFSGNHWDDDFGDPFNQLGDPLRIDTPASGFVLNPNMMKSDSSTNGRFEAVGGSYRNPSVNLAHHMIMDDEITRRPSDNLFSRMLQISSDPKFPAVSPCDPPVVAASSSSMLLSNDKVLTFPDCSKLGCLVESPGLQISPPRNTGIKRRKSQAKKVVCIPAPAPANTRHTGEVVPSDLWAWRKYGQKPIKGSPFPRGYFRCSSSKGCSARKQVERSRTDPSMLVITYTSDHNHPWPTQRNALAGSTRSHPIKTNPAARKSPNSQAQEPPSPDEEKKEITSKNIADFGNCSVLKVEKDLYIDNQLEMDGHYEDFYGDFVEMEPDALDSLLTQRFSSDEGCENKTLDPFSFYDCPANYNYPATREHHHHHHQPGP
ncbi:probable WRKY transcription factor 14 [Primulina huaijiensis]|uniref:probable WRKY transcription factor 14 n=1 Tax=Primulina huaijiensis TaxID=1492673 RepID=UPI003CC7092E